MAGRFNFNGLLDPASAMPRNVYSELNLHITWHTKQSLPLITASIEPRLYAYLKHRILETPGGLPHAIGGTENHIHLAVSVPSTLLLSDWIGKLKGASAHYINHQITKRKSLEWQSGYGVVSFGTKSRLKAQARAKKPVKTGCEFLPSRAQP